MIIVKKSLWVRSALHEHILIYLLSFHVFLFLQLLHFSLASCLYVKWCVCNAFYFGFLVRALYNFGLKKSAYFFSPVLFIFLFAGCDAMALSSSQVRPLGHFHVPDLCWCCSCSTSGGGMDLAGTWSSCMVIFGGYLSSEPAPWQAWAGKLPVCQGASHL